MKVLVRTKSQDFDTVDRKTGVRLEKPLHWYLSLAGDSRAQVSPLVVAQAGDLHAFRYDWIVGLSCVAKEDDWWDWQAKLRKEDALKIQLLIAAPPELSWTEVSAELLALHPSRDTNTWFEENASEAMKAAGSLAKIGANAALAVAPGLALGAQIINAIPSEKGKRPWFLPRKKNWYLYRYFDSAMNCPAVEWVISKDVMRHYGPLMRGSLILAFHGESAQDARVRIRLRAGLGLLPGGDLNYVLPGGEKEPLLDLITDFAR
jgi:hypothetical protein